MPVATEYKTNLKPIWCPGCGDFGVLAALAQAFAQIEIPRKDIALLKFHVRILRLLLA